MDIAAVFAGLVGMGLNLFRLHRDLIYLQGQVHGALAASVVLLGLYMVINRPTPRS